MAKLRASICIAAAIIGIICLAVPVNGVQHYPKPRKPGQRKARRARRPIVAISDTQRGVLLDAHSSISKLSSRPLGPVHVPGLKASNKFATRIVSIDGQVGSSTELFTFITESKTAAAEPHDCNGYFSHLEGWTHSWVNLEMPRIHDEKYAPVRLEVAKLHGEKKILSATITPARNADVRIENGKAVVTLHEPCQISIDIDSQMETTNTGPDYEGSAIHTYSIFANPEITDAPNPEDANVRVVRPGTVAPTDFKEDVLYFAPGVHRLTSDWSSYTLLPGKTYYVPADAWVQGPLSNANEEDRDIRLFGYGTIAGDEIEREVCQPNESPEALALLAVMNTSISGLTFVDFPNHHLILGGAEEPSLPNSLSHVKVLGWRANGDGVHVFEYWRVSDLFLRTQDDSLYIASGAKEVTFERITTWNDANGGSFIFTAGHGGKSTLLKDSYAIYSRSSWAYWDGGRVFALRGMDKDQVVSNITIDGVEASDPLPTLPLLDINFGASASLLAVSTTHGLHADGHGYGLGLTDGYGLGEDIGSMIMPLGMNTRQVRNAHEHIIYRETLGSREKALTLVAALVTDITLRNIVVRNYSSVQSDTSGVPLLHGLPNIIHASGSMKISNLAFENVRIGSVSMSNLVADPTYFSLSHSGLSNVTVDGHPLTDFLGYRFFMYDPSNMCLYLAMGGIFTAILVGITAAIKAGIIGGLPAALLVVA